MRKFGLLWCFKCFHVLEFEDECHARSSAFPVVTVHNDESDEVAMIDLNRYIRATDLEAVHMWYTRSLSIVGQSAPSASW